MISPTDVLNSVIRPTLEYLEENAGIAHTEEAEILLLMTAAHESKMGSYLKQVNGPALGIFQMEPATHDSLWKNYLKFRTDKYDALTGLTHNGKALTDQLEDNLMYATAMARMKYLPVKQSIPKRVDYDTEMEHLQAIAQYAKDHYNTSEGKATPEKYLQDYLEFV